MYDELTIAGAAISEDVRDVLDRRPNTPQMFVFAPFHPEEVVLSAVQAGTGAERASGDLAVVVMRKNSDQTRLVAMWQPAASAARPRPDSEIPLEMQQGWLFDLFDRHQGLVDAPLGVHFGKASGKHANKFLRTSSVLLSTAACGLLASLALVRHSRGEVRRIFVDTAPLLSVVFAMHRIASAQGLWKMHPPARSFSSYGGLEQLPSVGGSDLALISASTSGGLAARLVDDYGFDAANVLTLYVLQSSPGMRTPGKVLCDLTFDPGRTFGYPRVVNQSHSNCDYCKMDWLLAELEGDQFLLQKRGIKRLRSNNESQSSEARKTLDSLARLSALRVRLYEQGNHRTDIAIDVEAMLNGSPAIREKTLRIMKRFTPTPVSYVILVDLQQELFEKLVTEAGIRGAFAEAQVVSSDRLAQLSPIEQGNALVMVGCLTDHAALRGVNAQLRVKVPHGCVSYISALTVADSGKNLNDLKIFLSWGEHGSETFTFRSAAELMLPWRGDHISSWESEREFLLRLDAEGALDAVLAERLRSLGEASRENAGLFLPGRNGELKIAADFVYLDTREDIGAVSQADIYTVVSNLLANARCENQGLKAPSKDKPTVRWSQSVYGQVLVSPATLCPSNFRDYNDAILRAAFLRAAHPAELNFSVDETCSAEVLDILVAEVDAWFDGKGDALPEFLMALATGRLRLQSSHTEQIRAAVSTRGLPESLEILARRIPRL
ncbi:hypothetical protein [uncultured Pseudacidovorax sp.]|uniref:hypothetical protein n=1 Tax=uncultured Pseudacidovorax sp. TaxID=679313 RepID=UPI0025E27EF3|nr:hypothetical protein [uncultured Pseudacidovorax sp.]